MILSHGRALRKLRVQLLDGCNYRCHYCMPENPQFSKADSWLKPQELQDIVFQLHDRGVDELRLTGGEPLLRPEFMDIAQRLSQKTWRRYGITTNAEKLSPMLGDIKKFTSIQNLNISMDSLDPVRFKSITARGNLENVLGAVHDALSLGFEVKINVVLMRGINDDEFEDFIRFSADTGVVVRFLELMRIGPNEEDFGPMMISAGEMVERLKGLHELKPVVVPKDHTAFEYKLNHGAHIGFIASESQSFCSTCSRLRLTSSGELRPCLFKNEGISLRNLKGADLDRVLEQVAQKKPLERIQSIDQAMYAIGG